jgi:hypothetical protein
MIWLLNLYLYFMYLQNPAVYQELVASGMPCWQQTSTAHLPLNGPGITGNIQPACWYDPNNTNDGHLRTLVVMGPLDAPADRKER